MTDLEMFCRQIRRRSQEHQKAIDLLSHHGLTGQVIAILRQELDSLVRCIFLLSLRDIKYRHQLVSDTISGRPWRNAGGRKRVTDREMVDLAIKLHGWARNVYSFGCAFIHLSNFHDYEERNPLLSLDPKELDAIQYYLSYYHGLHFDIEVNLTDITPYLPMVFEKISGNLEYYLKELESDSVLALTDI